jgi:hypothetical protein
VARAMGQSAWLRNVIKKCCASLRRPSSLIREGRESWNRGQIRLEGRMLYENGSADPTYEAEAARLT